MEKGIDIKAKTEVESAFEKLSIKEQKELVKTLIWKTIAHEYIERKTEAFKNGKFTDYPNVEISEEDVETYRYNLVNKVADAVYPMVDVMFCDDDELKYRIFEKLIYGYGPAEKASREDVCGYNHDYADWETKEGHRPVFDEDGDMDGTCWGEYYTKTCKYCGKTIVTYSEEGKIVIDSDIEYEAKRHPKKNIYTLNNN